MKKLHVFNSDLTDGKNKRIMKGKKLYLIGITSLSLALASLAGCSNKNDNTESSATYESPVIDTTTDVLANNAINEANNLLSKCENIEMTDELDALMKAVNSKKTELALLLKGYGTTGDVSGVTKIDAIKVCIEELEEACNKLSDYLFRNIVNNSEIESTQTPVPTEKPNNNNNNHGKKQDNQKPSQTTQPTQTTAPSATQTPVATTQPTQVPASTTAPQVISSPAPMTIAIPVWTPGPSTTTPTPTQTPAPTATQTPVPSDIPTITDEELNQLIENSSSTNGQIGNTTGDVNSNNIYQGSDGDYYVSESPVPTQTPAPQNNEPEFTIPEGAYTVDGYVWASYDEYIGWIDEGCPEIQMDENGICYKSSKHR